MRWLLLLIALMAVPTPLWAVGVPPVEAEIVDAAGQRRGTARVYPNYVEVDDGAGRERGRVGVVMMDGRAVLFTVSADEQRTLVGWARDHRLYDSEDELVGYYFWSPIRSYIYDPEMNKVGQAQCLAYQGVCAAGVAGYLLGLY